MWQHVCNTKYVVIYHVKIFILSLLNFIVILELCIQITRLFGMKMFCYAYNNSRVCMLKFSNTHIKFRKNLFICSGVVKEEASMDNMVIL